MGQKTYFHNLTKGLFNQNDIDDAVESSEVGDKILFSHRDSGALMYDVKEYNPSIADENYESCHHRHEYDYIRNEFKARFLEFHGVSYQ